MRPFVASKIGLILAAGMLASTASWASCTSVLSAGTCVATVSATSLAFGNYDASSSTAKDVASTLTVNATATGPASLLTTIGYTISLGTGVTGTVADRRMTSGRGGPSLAYNLYTTSNRDVVWGTNGVTDSIPILASLLGTSASRLYTVYGRVPVGQYVSAGTDYVDTMVVTVTY